MYIRHFLNSDISQGSVATFIRCGGTFDVHIIANLLTSPSVKELWKSVSIWRSYWQKCGYPFLLAHPVHCTKLAFTVCWRMTIEHRQSIPVYFGQHELGLTLDREVIMSMSVCRCKWLARLFILSCFPFVMQNYANLGISSGADLSEIQRAMSGAIQTTALVAVIITRSQTTASWLKSNLQNDSSSQKNDYH